MLQEVQHLIVKLQVGNFIPFTKTLQRIQLNKTESRASDNGKRF